MAKGKVAMLVAKRKFEIQEYDIPEINDDQMLVKIEGVGVCGTDAHEYKNDPFGYILIVLGIHCQRGIHQQSHNGAFRPAPTVPVHGRLRLAALRPVLLLFFR